MAHFNKKNMVAMSVLSPYNLDWFPKMSVDTREDFSFALDHLKYINEKMAMVDNQLRKKNDVQGKK